MNTQPNSNVKPPVHNNDEIDLLELAKTFWNGRKIVLKSMFIAGILGVIIAILSPKEYTATTTIVPQTSSGSNKLGGLSSLAAMASFNLDAASSGDILSPSVYPEIVSSVPFQMDLMNIPFSFAEVNHPVSLYEYYAEISKPGALALIGKYTIGLPGVIISAIKGDSNQKPSAETKGPIALTNKQEAVRKLIASQVTLNLDAKQGFITIQAAFPEALLSAQVADQARELLQKYITRFKIEKATDKLSFIEERYQEKKKEFEKAQTRLAYFSDQNKNVTSAVARTEETRLQGDYTIAMNVYNELAKQLEQAKIQVKEETPVFSVLKPATVPSEKSKPKKPMIVAIWLFLGGIVGTGMVFGKVYLKDIRTIWNETV
jgi:uncharacterized protein involved in exopolysaccharide biosynthesis